MPDSLQIQLLLFARLREELGVAQESLFIPPEVCNVGRLVEHLRLRGDQWAHSLGANQVFRVAVDQTLASMNTPLHNGAEVALFPPVTGG